MFTETDGLVKKLAWILGYRSGRLRPRLELRGMRPVSAWAARELGGIRATSVSKTRMGTSGGSSRVHFSARGVVVMIFQTSKNASLTALG